MAPSPACFSLLLICESPLQAYNFTIDASNEIGAVEPMLCEEHSNGKHTAASLTESSILKPVAGRLVGGKPDGWRYRGSITKRP